MVIMFNIIIFRHLLMNVQALKKTFWKKMKQSWQHNDLLKRAGTVSLKLNILSN